MKKKRFYKLRQALMCKVLHEAKKMGCYCGGFNNVNRMPRPNFIKVNSYSEAWELLKPLRESVKFEVEK